MVNLTEMAKPFGKEPHSFLKTKQTQRFIQALEESVPTIDGTLKIVKGNFSSEMGNPITQGTWAHQKLALKFAGWLDPRFELWVYDRVEELLKSGYTKLDSISVKDLARMLLSSEEEKDRLLEITEVQAKELKEAEPRVLFARSLETSRRSILVAELAKLLSQNGINMGQNRLFAWLRDHNYLGTRGEYYNTPSQISMEMGLFELKKTAINKPDGTILVSTTPKVTGRGQLYFIGKFLKQPQNA
ncbi:MAG: phage antirepressor KilAC domain-containing protein [Bacteroidetes bacterium]|nr:phage antirepressor KilAC domain-containing protein [Bacteroidota bacterium]